VREHRGFLWFCFTVPLLYAGIMLTIAVHEGGHWASTLFSDWSPEGIRVSLDGTGEVRASWRPPYRGREVYVVEDWEVPDEILIGGVAATLAVGIFLRFASRWPAGRPLLSGALLLLAGSLMLDAPCYLLWDAAHGGSFGDIARLFPPESTAGDRAPYLVLGGLGIAAVLASVTPAFFRRVEETFGPLPRDKALILAGGMVLLVIAREVWTHKHADFPDILLPVGVASLSQLAIGVYAVRSRRRRVRAKRMPAWRWGTAITLAWLAFALVIVVLQASGLDEGLGTPPVWIWWG
jgi:hypothetical protein